MSWNRRRVPLTPSPCTLPFSRVRPASLSIALGSDPHIHMEVGESGEVRLECTSVGWYPEPQVQWSTSEGETFPSTSESRNPDEEGLFTVVASVIIRDPSMKNISCCIRNLLLGQQREVDISIPGQWNQCWVPIRHSFRAILPGTPAQGRLSWCTVYCPHLSSWPLTWRSSSNFIRREKILNA